jgi:hypothetical protein
MQVTTAYCSIRESSALNCNNSGISRKNGDTKQACTACTDFLHPRTDESSSPITGLYLWSRRGKPHQTLKIYLCYSLSMSNIIATVRTTRHIWYSDHASSHPNQHNDWGVGGRGGGVLEGHVLWLVLPRHANMV